MKIRIKHEIRSRLRVHLPMERLTFGEADTLDLYLQGFSEIKDVRIYERTADVVICFKGERTRILQILKDFSFEDAAVPERVSERSARELSAAYRDRIITDIFLHYGKRLFLPFSIRRIWERIKAVKYIIRGLRSLRGGKVRVELLDAVAITAAIVTGDYKTASSVMFLLKIGDTLEEWTHKRTVDDLARRMSLNIGKVWLVTDTGEVLTDSGQIVCGDRVHVQMGNMIPFDGEVCEGEAMVNQASMTGEAAAVRKCSGAAVFAGTVVEEGQITIRVTQTEGCGRFDKIVKMIMPLSVLSAIREAADYGITVKGGRFLEAVADADTIVFDKTGTLTKAAPAVKQLVSFCDETEDECVLKITYFYTNLPWSMIEEYLDDDEFHF